MQSLMGDRLLKWFLNSSRRRFRRKGSKRADSISEMEGRLSNPPEGTSDGEDQADDTVQGHAGNLESHVQSQSNRGLQCSSGDARTSDQISADNEILVEDGTPSPDDTEGYES